jgi:hypothetical protein
MTEQQLNRLFTEHYQELRTYAHKALRAIKLNHEPETIVADSYIHLLAMVDEITDLGHLLAISKNYIKQNINWWNSPYRRQQRGSESALEMDAGEQPNPLPEFDTMLGSIERWRAQLCARDRRLFNVYTQLEIRKGADLSNYLNISQSGAYLLIREAKELENQLREWLIEDLAI